MKLWEFLEQDNYCREHNIPSDTGCDDCPADSEYCADALRNLCARFIASINNKSLFDELSNQLLEHYGLTKWNQLALFKGEIEFPE